MDRHTSPTPHQAEDLLRRFVTNGQAAQAAVDAEVAKHAETDTAAVDRTHIRIRYATLGAHTHCTVWSTEQGGTEVTHGRNGTLVFRNAEFDAFRALIEIGLDTTDHAFGRSAVVEFVEDPDQISPARSGGVVILNLPGDTPMEG